MELEDQAVLKTNNVKAIVSLLQIMKSTGKQVRRPGAWASAGAPDLGRVRHCSLRTEL